MLTPAATANIGKRQPRRKLLPASAVSSQHYHDAGPVRNVANVLCAVLVAPLRLIFTVDDAHGLLVYVFGRDRLRQFAVPEALLGPAELTAIQYLAVSAETWVDEDRWDEGSARQEVLVAGAECNDAVENALDRCKLCGAVCQAIVGWALAANQRGTMVRQIVEAAVMTASADAAVMASGYYEGLLSITHAIRLSQPRVHFLTDDQIRERHAEANMYTARYGIAHIRADAYMARICHDAKRPDDQPVFG